MCGCKVKSKCCRTKVISKQGTPGKPGKNGKDGTNGSTTVITNNTTTITTKTIPENTVQRAFSAGSTDISGSGVVIPIVTIPTGTPAINLVECNFDCHIHSTDVHNITLDATINGVGQGLFRKVKAFASAGSGDASPKIGFELAGVSVGDVIGVSILSDDGTVTPRLRGYYGSAKIYS
ncbi:MAG TPA: hypothetical protein ACFYEK_01405 [Candidatus Wunengus sp. YC60]|uniref:hypothetical protein n=1 Tax=Candidatus Wunengus sp. YC60 TaxID=3367697 RepID=UPI0040294F29